MLFRSAAGLRLVPEGEDAEPAFGTAPVEPPANTPKVFVRAIPTPPGLPWDQARAAALEARAGAPLPLSEVIWRLKRLGPWAPGRPGRWAAFYVRSGEVGEELAAEPMVEGRPVPIRFQSFAAQQRRMRRLAVLALSAGAAAALVLGLATAVISARAQAADRLDTLELTTARRLKQAEETERLRAQTRALDAAHVRGQTLDDVLKDLAWVSTAKAATARVEGVHWDRGYTAVEVRGDAAPFDRLDRPVQKSAKPARAGVWLWGVAPAEPGPRAGVQP